ncbi:MAG: Maf family protein [Gemmatimonadota bacterium]|nr:Maf family protein [Gemmatimonadota bacterium]
MVSKTRLILASNSPRRLDVLHQLGLNPVVRFPAVDEAYITGESPAAYVERLARAKAEVVAEKEPDALVIGGDTIVVSQNRLLGKPADEDAAVEILISLAGRKHQVLTGLAISGQDGTVSAVSGTEVRLRSFTEAEARRYVMSGEPMDKAGAYAIQGLGAALVAEIVGDYYTVMGFPVGTFLDLLLQSGWRYEFGSLSQTN